VGLGASWQWFLSSLILAGLFAFIGFRGQLRHWLPRASLSVFGFIVIVLNWLLAVSFYTQGTGFNDQLFFPHNSKQFGCRVGHKPASDDYSVCCVGECAVTHLVVFAAA